MSFKTKKTIDEYIQTFPKDVQDLLQKVRQTIKKSAPESTEVISYGVPGFKLNGKNLILFSSFKKHIGIYPDPKTIVSFKKELSKYKTSKGAIQFQLNEKVPFGLIKKITEFRAKEI